jgi:hypothetical protein
MRKYLLDCDITGDWMVTENARSPSSTPKANLHETRLKEYLRREYAGLTPTAWLGKRITAGKRHIKEEAELRGRIKGYVEGTREYVYGLLDLKKPANLEPHIKLLGKRSYIFKDSISMAGTCIPNSHDTSSKSYPTTMYIRKIPEMRFTTFHEAVHSVQNELGYFHAIKKWQDKEWREKRMIVPNALNAVLSESAAVFLSSSLMGKSDTFWKTASDSERLLLVTAYSSLNASRAQQTYKEYSQALPRLRKYAKEGRFESMMEVCPPFKYELSRIPYPSWKLMARRVMNALDTPRLFGREFEEATDDTIKMLVLPTYEYLLIKADRMKMRMSVYFMAGAIGIMAFAASDYDVAATAKALFSENPRELFDRIGRVDDNGIRNILRVIEPVKAFYGTAQNNFCPPPPPF